MMIASSSDALLMLGKWKETRSQLQVLLRMAGAVIAEFSATVETVPTDESTSKVLLFISSAKNAGQKRQWEFSLDGCSLWYAQSSARIDLFPDLTDKWLSCLAIGFVNVGLIALFVEREDNAASN
jgi:hypothetical protein